MTRGEALKRLFPQDHPAGGVGRAAVLHLPLRLRKERGAGLSGSGSSAGCRLGI